MTAAHKHLYLIGANHTSAPMELREKLYIPPDKLAMILPELKKAYGFLEIFVLSTCNRFEMMSVAPDTDEQRLFQAYMFLQENSHNTDHLVNTDLRDHLYVHENGDAIHHVYRVASSLDSLVLGETQITGQFKDAISLASKSRTLGPLLNRLSQEALATAKKVRTQTAIGEKHVSISHAALDLAKKVYGDLSDHKYLIIGAGEMARIAAKNIMQYSPKDLFVANRTIANAEKLVDELGFGQAFSIDELSNLLSEVDVVISSTAAQKTVIDRAMVKRAKSSRRAKPMILLDIALPRDIDPTVGELEDIYLFDIDDLQQVVGHNFEERRKAAAEAESLIEESVSGFETWLASFDLKPVLADFNDYMAELFDQELQKSLGKAALSGLTEDQKQAVGAMQRAIVGKITGDVSRMIKNPPEGFFKEQLADAVQILFPKKGGS